MLATVPAAGAEPPLSPGLQAYLRNCVQERLQEEGHAGSPWFRIHLYLRLGDAGTAAALDRDLRQHRNQGLIALFGQLAPELPSMQAALARQLHLMHGYDRQLQLVSAPAEQRPTQLQLGEQRFAVFTLHGDADCLHRVMPCPMLVFCPLAS
ncbi:hypothetical protein [Pelomonas sp. KK5]|uniref:hypothetical protein n=1 Tax=Pelomonas sp. KK5 TaxID=1855730 RepID=UPI00097C434D|nr:hypothetical protein [Pelomonas sp. KK5]